MKKNKKKRLHFHLQRGFTSCGFVFFFFSYLKQIVQGVEVLVQTGLRALHSVSLVLEVRQPGNLDLSSATAQ